MKKITAVITAILFCALLVLSASAADYKLHENGEAYYETAVGYVFKIDDINGVITGEDSTLVTDDASLAASGSKWAIWFQAEKVADNIYVAITEGKAMGGALPAVSLSENQIVIIVHSASSKPAEESLYQNWESKVAALAVKSGDYLVLNGIDLEAKTSVDGTITVASKDEIDDGNIQLPETSEPETSAPEVEESTTVSEVESAPELGKTPENTDYSDPEVKSSTMKIKSGFWDHNKGWIITVSAILVVIIAVIVVVIVKGKKKPEATEEPKE